MEPLEDFTAVLGTARTSAAVSVMMLAVTVMPLLMAGFMTSGVMTAEYETTPEELVPTVSTRVTLPVRVMSVRASNVRVAF